MNGLFRTLLTLMLVIITGAAVFVGGFVAGHYTATPLADLPGPVDLVDLASSPPGQGGTPSALEDTFAPFWEAWDIVHEEYVDQPLDDAALMQGAIDGMMQALGDQHSSYIPPEEYSIINADQSGEFEGIGAYVDGEDGVGLRIVSPFPGSPAQAAGLLPGDLITAVNGRNITDLTETEAVNLVRGPAGSRVTLTIVREAEDGASATQDYTVIRAKISVASVESKLLAGNIAYVKINDFGQRTLSELRTALQVLRRSQPRGLILDLRGNPGGFLNTAIEVSSQFLPRGTLLMREQFGDGREVEYDARGGGLATDLPMVVLIDKGSASASEIVAGAIQDHGRGLLIGETSYGKGSVQNWHALLGDSGAIRVTIARWYTPGGRSIHELGITPDIPIERTEEDHAAQRDPQLDEALRQLSGVEVASSARLALPQ